MYLNFITITIFGSTQVIILSVWCVYVLLPWRMLAGLGLGEGGSTACLLPVQSERGAAAAAAARNDREQMSRKIKESLQ